MATNTGKDYRQGAVKGKTQSFNPTTGKFVKRDTKTGQFEAVKKDGKPFKGVRVEKMTVKFNPNIPKETLEKARKAVQAVMSRRAA